MQSSWRVCAAAAVMAAFAGGTALAGPSAPYRGEATLAAGATASRTETIAGATWTCDGAACVGVAPRKANLDAPVRECKKVAAVLGPVTAYRSGARELSESQLRACNKGAGEVHAAAN